jgi:hypothetical protein
VGLVVIGMPPANCGFFTHCTCRIIKIMANCFGGERRFIFREDSEKIFGELLANYPAERVLIGRRR